MSAYDEAMAEMQRRAFPEGEATHPNGAFIQVKNNEELSDENDVSAIPKYEDVMRQYFQTVNANPIKKGA